MKSLADFMDKAECKTALLEELTPKSRDILFSPVSKAEDIPFMIQSILSLASVSLQHQQEPIKIQFPLQDGKNLMTLTLPFFGKKFKLKSRNTKPSRKVAILFNILNTVKNRLENGQVSTIRDLYYSNVELYENQRNISFWLSILTRSFRLPSKDLLNIIPAQKGLIYSPIKIMVINNEKVQIITPFETTLIPYLGDNTKIVLSKQANVHINRVLVLEKEAIFSKLVSSRNSDQILITGKGYPDFLTRKFLKLFHESEKESIKNWDIITDADPHGVNITFIYMQTNTYLNYCGATLLQLINLNLKHLSSATQLLSLDQRDVSLTKTLLGRVSMQEVAQASKLKVALQRQMFFQKKGEMNALYSR
ncbi:hypothetical protein NCAS_0F01490 [Naumovozyma castellii]|uniref:DNA topoisomerase (ATP-hydrolyzing) n=1 Tax=Naumovozyma castellii TaxID=27288 RepID=G0VGL2_NAUCA|nr:hypothetical protein NCAS_0F01490 [Naumovozyma castellii CBS 4309]CCC70633.1 hypothetical protein NCAS_0F01490 [Naumovozyma castellii CBS 4309]